MKVETDVEKTYLTKAAGEIEYERGEEKESIEIEFI